MTIDEIIEELEDSKDYPTSDPASDEALEGAIAIMRKYQKIQEIVSDRYGKPMFKFMDAIVKVVEDGNE